MAVTRKPINIKFQTMEATFAALEHRLNELAAERGELSLTIPAACIQASKPAAE